MADESYLFVFGRTPDLAFGELTAFFPAATRIREEVALVGGLSDEDAISLMSALGGCIRIARVVGRVNALTAEYISDLLRGASSPVTFGISAYGHFVNQNMLSDIKDNLIDRGIHARYVATEHGEQLSSVVVDKKHVEECITVKTEADYVIARTVAVQPYESWGQRDYGRPNSDVRGGMLPPKVARMIINMADGLPYGSTVGRQKTLFDPFCGMGTILSEAYLMGWRVIGSDISEKVVQKAKGNVSWLESKYPKTHGDIAKVFVLDAAHASEAVAPNSVDAIVTEPFMGATSIVNQTPIDVGKVKNVIKGLEKLYIGCLRDWVKILAPEGKVIIALPAYAVSGREYFVKKVVDMCENLGYTIVAGPIEYSRPQAIVKRKFYVLRKK